MKQLTILLTLSLLLLCSCRNVPVKNQNRTLTSTTWNFCGLKKLDALSLQLVPASLNGMNITFNMNKRFQAQSSCNIIYGAYTIPEDGSLKIDSIAITKMFCPDSLEITWEENYVSALRNSKTLIIKNDTLVIKTDSLEMIFLSGASKK
jgi:heat shock protein HslJ